MAPRWGSVSNRTEPLEYLMVLLDSHVCQTTQVVFRESLKYDLWLLDEAMKEESRASGISDGLIRFK